MPEGCQKPRQLGVAGDCLLTIYSVGGRRAAHE